MTLASTLSVALLGVDGYLVEVEADLAAGLPSMTLIGLPDATLHEARDRIRAAVLNSGQSWPSRRITIGLSPAWRPKRGSSFDLAIAAAVLSAAGVVPGPALKGVVLLGELGLDGRVRPVTGALPAVLAAAAAGVERVVVPAANAREAALVPGVVVTAVDSLRMLVALLTGDARLTGEAWPTGEACDPPSGPVPETGEHTVGGVGRADGAFRPDLADVVGQLEARWALEIAAAGGHHLFLQGPPGVGKTMLAERLPGLLPPLDLAAALEVTAVHSVAGALRADQPLVTSAPFAAPHHTSSVPAIIGGGTGLARPGAASLAHRGVLFLDEAPEFATGCLDALRQPLESGEVVLARSGGTVRYPARFTLVLAANPCPCGKSEETCGCTPDVRRRYRNRLSGPLLDRVDLVAELTRPSKAELLAERAFTESTTTVADRVRSARELGRRVFADRPWALASEIPGSELRGTYAPAAGAIAVLEPQLRRGGISARGLDRTLRVAWTLALCAGRSRPEAADVHTAMGLRLGAAA
jgi:magnesium chelatase family protein